MFNQMFDNPYLRFLPPEAQQMLQQRQMFDMGTSLLQNSVSKGSKPGLAAFGNAMAQYKQGQMQDATQMTEMQRLAEAIRLANEKNQREAGMYRGEDFGSREEVRQADMRDATARRQQDMMLKAAGIRAQGMAGMGFDPNAEPPMSQEEKDRRAYERLRAERGKGGAGGAGGDQTKAPERQPDPARRMALEQEMSFLSDMSLQELDEFENRYGDVMEYRHRAALDQARMNKQGRRYRLPDTPDAWRRPGDEKTGGGF